MPFILLHHLLLEEFLANQHMQLPFGFGPWVCINPLAKHFNLPSISHYLVHNNRRHHVAVFECYCGYTYTRWFDQLTGKIGPKRFYEFGSLLNPVLSDFVAKGVSLREIGRRLGVDPKTVIKLATDLGIQHPWKVGNVKCEALIYTYKSKPPKVSKVRNHVFSKIDWKTIDKDLKYSVKAEVSRLRKISPPIKLTLSEIERGLGRTGWIGRRKSKLPLTSKYLKSIIEEHPEYQLRKLIWAIKELKRTFRSVAPSNVTKLAGFRHDAFNIAKPKLFKYLR